MADDWIVISSTHLDSYCGQTGGLSPEGALDGTSYWKHTVVEVHWLILDLGQTYTIKKVRGRSETNNDPTSVSIYVSDDTGDWGTAVATGISTWQDTDVWQEVDTTDKDGRYVKVVIAATEFIQQLYFGRIIGPFSIFDAYGSVPAPPPSYIPRQSGALTSGVYII